MDHYIDELFTDYQLVWVVFFVGLIISLWGVFIKQGGKRGRVIGIGLLLLSFPIITIVGKISSIKGFERKVVSQYKFENDSVCVVEIFDDKTFISHRDIACLPAGSGSWSIREGDMINLSLKSDSDRSSTLVLFP